MFERLPPSKKFFAYICFFLASILATFVFFSVGISNLTNKKYVIYFDRSISGLKVGNQVFFKGVPVGLVDKIEIELPSTQRIKVVIKVTKKMILYEGCTAKIGMQGLTGYSVLELSNHISGGFTRRVDGSLAQDLRSSGGGLSPYSCKRLSGYMPEIKSEYSSIEKLFETIPEMVTNANELIKALHAIVVKNSKNIDGSIVSLVQVLDSMNSAFISLNESAKTLNRCGARIESNLLPTAESSFAEFTQAMKIWKEFSTGSMVQLMDLINNVNNITNTLNESLNTRSGYISYMLGLK